MSILHVRPSAIAALLLLLGLANQPAFSRGTGGGHDSPWNPEHIGQLPPEVRNAVIQMCRDPHAGHYFATYFDNSRLIKLHFEHLHCPARITFCRQDGCLHQEYVSTGGDYRLMRSYYGRNND